MSPNNYIFNPFNLATTINMVHICWKSNQEQTASNSEGEVELETIVLLAFRYNLNLYFLTGTWGFWGEEGLRLFQTKPSSPTQNYFYSIWIQKQKKQKQKQKKQQLLTLFKLKG